jgi:tetratricopeptide (TPR) repeat protein
MLPLRISLLLFFLLADIYFLNAQSDKMGISSDAYARSMDSLDAALKVAKHDTILMKLIMLKSDLAVTLDPKLAEGFCLQVKSIAETVLADPRRSSAEKKFAKIKLGAAFGNLGYIAKHTNRAEKAEEYLRNALLISRELKDQNEEGKNLFTLASLFFDMGQSEKSSALFKESIEVLKQTNDKKNLIFSYTGLSNVLTHLGKENESLEHLYAADKLLKDLNDPQAEATVNCYMAVIYSRRANVPKALELYDKALSAFEKINDIPSMMGVLNIIGTTYTNQGELDKALSIFERVLTLSEKRNAKDQTASALHNIAAIYSRKKQPLKAIETFERSIKINEEINDLGGVANSYVSIGAIYKAYGDPNCKEEKTKCIEAGYEKALEFNTKALELYNKTKSKMGISLAICNIASVYIFQKKYDKAIANSLVSYQMGIEMRLIESQRANAKNLYDAYKQKGDHIPALKYYEIYIKMNDSIQSDKNRKAAIRSHLKYEYEKQAAADSVAHAKESEIKNVELKRQTAEIKAKKNQQVALFGGLALVMIFAGFMYNRFKITQKQKTVIEQQKKIVEEQKHLVEEKQQEILDSIKYARRIQLAQIPSEKMVQRTLRRLKK